MKKMRPRYVFTLIAGVLLVAACASMRTTPNAGPTDPEIAQLVAQMSVEEKVGQMTQLNLDVVCVGDIYALEEPHRLDPVKLRKALVEYHVGSILNCGGHAYPREQWLELIGGIQQVATQETRLKIPVLYGIDAIHGANYVSGSTLFPQQLAQAATFDPELTREAARITAYETRAAGIPWNFSPVLDVARNPLWSRYFETFGEDPLVCARFGAACTEGYQGGILSDGELPNDRVAACMKHFLGYSGARTGKDRTPAYLSDIELRQVYLPSFQAAIRSGALTVMINSGEINGIPVHADKKILTDLLRTELKFEGVAVTDWEDIIKLHVNHQVAPTLKEAVYQAVEAGIDMCMVPNDYDFTRYLVELVKEGRIAESRLDVSVTRILTLKKKLGILREAKLPATTDFPLFASKQHQRVAKATALESITLLENRNATLPLSEGQRVLVTGPAAHSMNMLNGAWTRTWQGTETAYDDTTRKTIYESLRDLAKGPVTYTPGCTEYSMLDAAEVIRLSAESDVIIACMGEGPSTEKPGDIVDLALPDAQVAFVQRLVDSGKPVVLVLVENRPRIVREVADLCAAVVMAYEPGDHGGEALADILYGVANPSGKLPFTYPRYANDLVLYDHKQTETIDPKFGRKAFHPQWEFGYGLSYADIRYESLTVSSDTLRGSGTVDVRVTIRNNSPIPAKEAVLLFHQDRYASVTPSVKRLTDFTKVDLAPNSTREVVFTLKAEDLRFIGRDLKPMVEEGDFELQVGPLRIPLYYSAS